MEVLGFDPGLSGAWALLYPDNTIMAARVPVVNVGKGKKVSNEVLVPQLIEDLSFIPRGTPAIIEKVAAMPKQGVASTFKFGETAGLIRGVLIALGFSLTRVAPITWKRMFGLSSSKEASVARACELFPSYVTIFKRPSLTKKGETVDEDGLAEAALLAYYLRCTLTNQPLKAPA